MITPRLFLSLLLAAVTAAAESQNAPAIKPEILQSDREFLEQQSTARPPSGNAPTVRGRHDRLASETPSPIAGLDAPPSDLPLSEARANRDVAFEDATLAEEEHLEPAPRRERRVEVIVVNPVREIRRATAPVRHIIRRLLPF